MASSQIKLKLSALDTTGAAFKNVKKNLAEVSEKAGALKIAKGVALGQALFSTVAGIASKAVAAAAELGTISDRAQQMSTSSEYAQKLAGALNLIGIKGANLDTLSKAFSDMQRVTGQAGEQGFKSVLTEMSKIENEQERLIELSAVFGAKMGPALAPLIRQGPEAFQKGLDDVMKGFPAVTDAAVNAGDRITDMAAVVNAKVKTGYQQLLGNIVNWIEGTFGMTFEEAMHRMIAYAKYGWRYVQEVIEVAIVRCTQFFGYLWDNWREIIDWMWNGIKEFGVSWAQYFKDLFGVIGTFAKEFGKAFVRWITGDEADWGGAWDKVVESSRKAGNSLSKALNNSIADKTRLPELKLYEGNFDKIKELRDQEIATAKAFIDGRDLFGGVAAEAAENIADTANKSAKKISDALKDAKYVSAGSNEALKMALQGATGKGLQFAGMKPAGASPVASASSGDAEKLSILKRIEKNTLDISTALKALGAV